VKLLRNAGDSQSDQTIWTSESGECQEQEGQEYESDADNEEHNAATTQTTREEFKK
jgi:hypothetical protein